MKRDKLHRLILLLSLLGSQPVFADRAVYDTYADTHDTIVSGVAMISPSTIERFVRQVIARKLGADMNGSRLRFQTQAVRQEIQIPDQDVGLREVMGALGIRKILHARLATADVGFNLPSSGLTLKVRQPKQGQFDVVARWRVTQLSAKIPQLKLEVPKGLFDRDFDIDARPIQIGLKPKSPAIQVELKLQVRLDEAGSKLRLVAFHTNLNSRDPSTTPQLDFRIGPLTIDGQPLVL